MPLQIHIDSEPINVKKTVSLLRLPVRSTVTLTETRKQLFTQHLVQIYLRSLLVYSQDTRLVVQRANLTRSFYRCFYKRQSYNSLKTFLYSEFARKLDILSCYCVLSRSHTRKEEKKGVFPEKFSLLITNNSLISGKIVVPYLWEQFTSSQLCPENEEIKYLG